ncbi:phenylacetate--CoA ligase family protein [Anaeromassilibacillus sp. An200]|uniref:phenylacetate--CoA ligase family protein n=1 Tax=Anaeromassilibacillus sp. An200 TaxID=1965587 RepID=UPI000B39590B|nr:phenylacetate--CoA ligase [Anaeromassilibacillus sp. An200]OUP13791.1 phenylacetate--CoA ligase [Anaeromassilibacillus sp. An200]
MQGNYFQPEIECASREVMHYIQSKRLRRLVERCYQNVPVYRKRMDEMGVLPGDIKEIEDVRKLPFTTKTDLRDNYPFGLFAVPKAQLARIHASSGTTGKQTVVGYTKADIDAWATGAARSIVMVGGTKEDFVHVSYGYGLFTGGLGLHYGAEKLGATAIPVSSGNTKRQVQILQDYGSDILCCTPSYAMYIGETVRDMGIDPTTLPVRAGIFGAEPWTEQMRKEIERLLAIRAFDIYGLSEIAGPGVACECQLQNGLHINEDMFYPEIIDPDTGETLPDGVYGELVFTCIGKEALPLMRYRTRDICSLDHTPCECGRTLVRMSKPRGRTDDMLIIRGINVFPSQIESVLLELGMDPNYQLVVDRINNLDTLEVQIEMTEGMFSDTVRNLESIEHRIANALQSTLNIVARIRLLEPKSIPRSEGKAKRVIDKRKV